VRAGWQAAACSALLVIACGDGAEKIPNDLLGRWASADPRYAERSLLISSHSLVFASSKTSSDNFAVRGVESHREADGSLAVEIAYGTRDEGLTLRVRRFDTKPPSLTLGDRPERWTLASGVGSPP
jgi:hypothetical protein